MLSRSVKVFYIVSEIRSTPDTKIYKHVHCFVTDGIDVWNQFVHEEDLEYLKFKDDELLYQLLHKHVYESAKMDVSDLDIKAKELYKYGVSV